MKANCKDAIEEIQAIIDVVESRGIAYVRKAEGAVDKLNNVLACLRCFEVGTQIPGEIALVRHGKWFFVEPGAVWCSECGIDSSLGDAETADETKRRIANGETPNYCPNCGAKMDQQVTGK